MSDFQSWYETLVKEYAGFNMLAAEKLVTNKEVSYLIMMEMKSRKNMFASTPMVNFPSSGK